ncbi:hypothetical protein AVEN_89554-1 [Araneus ventricosus]|uniref:Uncharacterized protein n=1 Tax=Araneus ventricosus TaxID=182803 RepID=A0A4Y2N2P6_ARAVE|nr:hypothetical protein AVEN_89554-1 [Araneus ventricosus]
MLESLPVGRSNYSLNEMWRFIISRSLTALSDIEKEHDTESEEDGDSGDEEVNNLEWVSSKDGVQRRKTKFRQNIRTRCHNIVSLLHGKKGPAKVKPSEELEVIHPR